MSSGGKSGAKAPEQTFEEVRYLKHLIETQKPVRLKLGDNEEVRGMVEYFRCAIPAHHARGPAQPVRVQARYQVPDRRITACSSWKRPRRLRAKPGRCCSSYSRAALGFELKGEFDLVTKADRASEKLIVERLTARFPEHGIVAEEGGGHPE